MSRSKIAVINGALFLLTIPYLMRLWIEAFIWRIERGPQMLGFSLVHGGAGVLTAPLVISWLASYAYLLFASAVVLLWIFPSVRARLVATWLVMAGGVANVGIQALAVYMQSDLPNGVLYMSGLVLSALLVGLLGVAVASLRFKGPALVV